ncbi:glycosyltransferase [Paraflavisolibacter sp. H34]|uniref:glycosyltransferase n=1 Tax=Huijunlia imazamoxiresistens TaxID=3127457 RepID=UPI003016C7D9
MCLITYITVVRNGAAEMEQTIKSILPFVSDTVEYIVIDGESTDGTLEIIKKYSDRISSWVSERDKGIYDAMNKGLAKARGHFVCFINIGDRLLDCPVAQLKRIEHTNAAAISFPVQLSSGKVFKPSFSARIILENTLHHQGTYYRKSKMGTFNLLFKIFADFDMNQNLFKNKEKVLIDHSLVTSYHSVEGTSQNKKHFNEIFKVVHKNYGRVFSFFSLVYFKLNYGLINKIRSVK